MQLESIRKPIIVNVLYHEPDYRFATDQARPKINWDTPDGQWVGIYNNEIPNKLGNYILQYTDEFEYEVWQPDYRADKEYSHRFDNGLVHRLFPASAIRRLHGTKIRKFIHSPQLVARLQEYGRKNDVVVNLNGDLGFTQLYLLESLGHLPLLQSFRGTIMLPQHGVFKMRKNLLASLTYYWQYRKSEQLVKYIDHVTYQNNLFIDELSKMYKGPKSKLTSGCDFSFWKRTDKIASRQTLGLPQDKFIMLSSSLLIPRKQVDALIRVYLKLDRRHDFMLIITGHGTDAYEAYLKQLAAPLIQNGKIKFAGFQTGKQMRDYYNAADLFINSSMSEGGPVSAMKALACETPVMSTRIGNVPERMMENGSGLLVDIYDYDQWQKTLEEAIRGKSVPVFDRQEAKVHYDWLCLAEQWAHIYRQLHQQDEKRYALA